MKIIHIFVLLPLALLGCFHNSDSIKIACEGEGEAIKKQGFEKETATKLKEDRTYLITKENYETINSKTDYDNELIKKNVYGYVARFKSFYGDIVINDGTNYTFRSHEKDGKTEKSEYIVKVSEDLIKIRQSNLFTPNNYLSDHPRSTHITLNIEIDRVSGKFTESYANDIEYGPMKGSYSDYQVIKGVCKRVIENQL